MQVAKWGNSLAIRIPNAVVKALDLKVGDELEIAEAKKGALTLHRRPDQATLLARLRNMAVDLPDDWKISREEMNARDPK